MWAGSMLSISGIFSYINWCWLNDGASASETLRNIVLVNAAIIGLPLAIWRSHVAASQTETAQHSLLNERYQKGAEMLGSESLSVRLGGIYALARLAREYPQEYHIQIMKLFCAFVRTRKRKYETNEEMSKDELPPHHQLREDVHEIIRAISDRSKQHIIVEKKEPLYCLNFGYAEMFGANLSGADLTDANLSNVNLFGATLVGTDLSRAFMLGAVMRGVDLENATLEATNLSSVHMGGCKGLTQRQFDMAIAHRDLPPDTTRAFDAETGEPLIWRGKT